MARSARRHEEDEPGALRAGVAAVSALVAQNPVLAGGATAFLVALAFVSANALWYQPHAHSGAFFATRDFPGGGDTTILIERPDRPRMARDLRTEQAQAALKEMHLYDGEVDGLFGPATRAAIEKYQSEMGFEVTGAVDELLLERLGAVTTTAGILPSPAPRPEPRDELAQKILAAAHGDSRVMKIQAGLRAFGNEGIEIDGVLGGQTRSAILEFQALFGLPETGEPEERVLVKMREIGLVD